MIDLLLCACDRKIINVPPPVRTARLELIPVNLPLVEAEMNGTAHLGELLQAKVSSWPPPLNDENSLKWTLQKPQANPENSGFLPWYIVLIQEQKRRLVGIAGIKGPPEESGTIEVGYSVVEEFQKRGIGPSIPIPWFNDALGLGALGCDQIH